VTTDLSIRPLTDGLDWDQYLDLSIRAFGPQEEPLIRANVGPVVADGRALAAFDGNRLVGVAIFHDMRQWWHGRAVPMAGVSGVKVAPEDRGRGIGRALMTALTEVMAGRGYPLSALFPATMTIYRSLGWEVAGHLRLAVLPARTLFTLARSDVAPLAAPGPGQLRRPGPGDAAEVLEVIGRCHALARDCGPVTFDEPTVRRWLTRPGRWADTARYAYLAPDGFAAYRWPAHGNEEVVVDRVLAASEQTTRALWGVVASHGSVASTVRAHVAASDPLWWLLREQDAGIAETENRRLRLLDAPAAIAARGFPATDIAVPLHVTDDLVAANSGRWDLTVQAGAGSLRRCRTDRGASAADASVSSGPPPLALGARGLAALYAGAPVATLRRAGLAHGGSPDADAALDSAFGGSAFMLDGF
jgi:predicted acetyltransferase